MLRRCILTPHSDAHCCFAPLLSPPQETGYPALDHKPALMRCYKKTTLRDGDGDAWIERDEFPALLSNLPYFVRLWDAFDEIEQDGDRRLDKEEFVKGAIKVGLFATREEAEAAFEDMDANEGGMVLFDEFVAYVARQKLAVNGEVMETYTSTDERPEDDDAEKAAPAAAEEEEEEDKEPRKSQIGARAGAGPCHACLVLIFPPDFRPSSHPDLSACTLDH